MNIEANGLVLRNIQIAGNRRLVTLLTREYGKITAIINQNSLGKTKASLWSKPFTYSKFDIYKNRDYFIVNKGSVLKSYYKIGEDVEKYMNASNILEFTDKILVENQRNVKQMDILIEYFDIVQERKSHMKTLLLAYKLKSVALNGFEPHINNCVLCGKEDTTFKFDISEGGIVCDSCYKEKIKEKYKENTSEKLIYECKFGIIDVVTYILANPLSKLKKLTLEDNVERLLENIIRNYIKYYMVMEPLKTEGFLD